MTFSTPVVMTSSSKPFRASFKTYTALIRVFHILKLNYIFISLKHYKLYQYYTNTMNHDITGVVKTLECLRDKLNPTIKIIEQLFQKNEQMHNLLRTENERLKAEVTEATEQHQKLVMSEKERHEALQKALRGRESQEEDLSAKAAELRVEQGKSSQLQEKIDKMRLEYTEAKTLQDLNKEQILNLETENQKLRVEIRQSAEISDAVKKDNAARMASMLSQNKDLAEQTDNAQAGARDEDAELQQLKLELSTLKSSMLIIKKQLDRDGNANPELRRQLDSALSTADRTPDGLKNKIKF